MRQRVKRVSFGSVALAGLLFGSAKLALSSDFAARQVVARLRAAVGAPVRVGTVALGFSASALHRLEVLENLTTPEPSAWTKADAVEVDLTLGQLLRGDLASGTVTVRNATVTLHFDDDGRLRTRLPTPPPAERVALPLVRLEGGTFTLRHDGVPDETFHNIHLALRDDGERLELTGTLDDPDWGTWKVSGGRERASDPFTLVLRTTKEVRATPALLRRAPFVPAVVWRQVELEGDTDCELTLRFEHTGHVRYRVVLNPRNTKVHVRAIDLRAETARGRVVVEDDVVTLEDVRGLTAGGDLRVGSVMDFRGDTDVLRFSIAANALRPRMLPERWRVPAVEGQVSGRAELDLHILNGRVTTSGSGEGTIRAFPLLPPIRLHLKAADGRFRFGIGPG